MAKEKNENPPSGEQALIRELAGLLDETGLTEIEIEKSGLKVRVARSVHTTAYAAPMASAPMAAAAATAAATPVDASNHPGGVKSPMVGTVYLAPAPGAQPFVEIGNRVSEGQTLLIIEAMKTMNNIPAPRAGTVVQILVDDREPVEFDQILVVIE